MNQSSCKPQLILLSLLLCFAIPSLRAGFVETFEDGTNDGDWRLTTSTEPVIEPDGGNPGCLSTPASRCRNPDLVCAVRHSAYSFSWQLCKAAHQSNEL